MPEDVGARTVLEVVEAAGRRLGLRVDRGRVCASGAWHGVQMRIDARPSPHLPNGRMRIVAELPIGTDLEILIVRQTESHLRSSPHVGSSRPVVHTGDPELDRWLELRGDAEPARVAAWLRSPGVVERLRALADLEALVIDRMTVRAFLDETASTDAHVATAERLRELAIALDAARASVPPSQTSAPWVPTFDDVARELGLRVETCPLAAVGRVDGFDVAVTVPGWGPFRDGVVLVDVSRPGPESRPWDVPAADDPLPRRLARRALRTALRIASRVGVGEMPLQRLLAGVRARPPFGLPPGFAMSGARDHRIVAATRLAPGCEGSLVLAVNRLVEALRAGPGRPGAQRPSPYR